MILENDLIYRPFRVQSRELLTRNNNGCHFSTEEYWGEWGTLSIRTTREEAEKAAEEWREYLKDCGRRIEYRVIDIREDNK